MTMTFYKQKTTLLLVTKLLTRMYVTGMTSWSLTHVKIKAACQKPHSENEHFLTGASRDQRLKLTMVNSEL